MRARCGNENGRVPGTRDSDLLEPPVGINRENNAATLCTLSAIIMAFTPLDPIIKDIFGRQLTRIDGIFGTPSCLIDVLVHFATHKHLLDFDPNQGVDLKISIESLRKRIG